MAEILLIYGVKHYSINYKVKNPTKCNGSKKGVKRVFFVICN